MSDKLICNCELCVKDQWSGHEDPEGLECHVQLEGQLEELLVKNFESIFKDAMSKVVCFNGQSAEEASRFFQKDGCFHGVKDALSKIVHKTLLLLARNTANLNDVGEQVIDFKDLERSVLEEMISALKDAHPMVREGDATCYLPTNDMNTALTTHQLQSFSIASSGENEIDFPPPAGSCQRSIENLAQLADECAGVSSDSSNLHSAPLPVLEHEFLFSRCGFMGCVCPGSEFPFSQNKVQEPNLPTGAKVDNQNHEQFPTSFTPCSVALATGIAELPASQFSDYNTEGVALCIGLPFSKVATPFLPSKVSAKNAHCALISRVRGRLLETPSERSATVQTGISMLQGSLQNETAFLSLRSGSELDCNKDCNQESQTRSSLWKNQLDSDCLQNENHMQNAIKNCSSVTCPKNLHCRNAGCIDEGSLIAAGRELSLTLASGIEMPKNQFLDQISDEHNQVADEVGSNNLYCLEEHSVSLDRKGHLLEDLQQRIRELEVEVQEQTQWAQEKVLQAASKLSKDYSELRALRMEREEASCLKKEIQVLEESSKKKASELEVALRKTIGQAECRSAAMRRLELENAEMRAEMEAAKLNAAESEASNNVVMKREKKASKKEKIWERQRAKLHEELAREKRKVSDLQSQLLQIKEQKHQAEVRLRQEVKVRESIMNLAVSETKAKEQIEATIKRKEASLRQKAEADELKHQDDIRRLEHEISHLSAAKIVPLYHLPTDIDSGTSPLNNSLALEESADRQSPSTEDILRERDCVMCMSEDRSIVFLPCAHQIICVKCNVLHERQSMKDCPSCRTPIQQRIKVYGVNI
ncbi:hypothetical protein O6H91_09G010200 [Diphasiastrum complanatum]|uniref:Uncharacterized protein n=2 Tax=Diphasiastrum complanatum TaxID=34168 RepID=A0ACC2CLL5_DIPCM|nr:hypothetical protein O6H91_09G010200 [Diphasiastrum complanatum]KAJ7542755.1 hypothetical protein O6H91_09G010200 [Diphasiastrum complanatum]